MLSSKTRLQLTLSTTQSLVFYGSFGEIGVLEWSSSSSIFLMESQEKFWSFHLSIFDRFESDPEEQLTDRAWGRLAQFLLVNWYNLTVIVVFNAGNVPFVHLSIHLNLGSQFANA